MRSIGHYGEGLVLARYQPLVMGETCGNGAKRNCRGLCPRRALLATSDRSCPGRWMP